MGPLKVSEAIIGPGKCFGARRIVTKKSGSEVNIIFVSSKVLEQSKSLRVGAAWIITLEGTIVHSVVLSR